MKRRHFKISSSKLFVFNNSSSKGAGRETDPTTTMITSTVTGLQAVVR